MKINAIKLDTGGYQLANGATLLREHDTLTPNGNRLGGRWALRSQNGDLLDYDKYINDLAERNCIDLYAKAG
jgi:hypothetical protein